MSIFDYAGREFLRFGIRNRLPLFDRSRRRFAAARGDESALEERAIPSSRTKMAIRAYFDARQGGDRQSAWDAIKEAALSWRADNNAGGVPVFDHLPLPQAFAADIAREFGENDAGRGPALRELLVQLDPGLAKQVRSQLEDALTLDRRQVSEGNGAFRLLGGNEDDEGGPLQSRQGPPQKSPPLPRHKPVDAAEEAARRAKCEQYRRDYAQQRRAIDDADREVQNGERRIQGLRKQRQNWLNEIAAIEEDLRRARSRSTDPMVTPILECREDHDPRRPPPRGRRERRQELERKIQAGLCTTLSHVDIELGKERYRERLEEAKAQEIHDLEIELQAAKQKLQEIDAQIAQAQRDLEKAKSEFSNYQRGLTWIFEQYEASCGDHRELYSKAP